MVIAPPKTKRSPVSNKEQTKVEPQSPNTHMYNNMFEMMMLQHQQRMEYETKRSEMMQTTMLASIAASNSSRFQMLPSWQLPSIPAQTNKQKALNELTTDECINILRTIGLDNYCSAFTDKKVDGPMLDALANPYLGQQIMVSLLLSEIYRLKANGYNMTSSTTST